MTTFAYRSSSYLFYAFGMTAGRQFFDFSILTSILNSSSESMVSELNISLGSFFKVLLSNKVCCPTPVE